MPLRFHWRGAKKPPRGTDVCVYHIGNNPDAHGWIVEGLRRTPGVVVLHDFVLHHLVAGLTIGRRDGHGYLDAMEREGGVVGRLLGHAVLDKRIPPLWENRPEDFHLAGEVLGLATGLIVHSHYVRDRSRAAGYEGPIWVVPHPAFPVPPLPAVDVRGEPLFGSFGNVNASKRVPQLLEAFARVRAQRSESRLLLVGATSPGFDLDRRLQRLGLDGAGIEREGYVEESRLWQLMAAADVHVNLRSLFLFCQVFGRHMLKQGRGKIINMGSLLSYQGGFTVPAYAASKHAVSGLTKSLCNEWAGKGINVNCIAPGYMDTDINVALLADPVRSRQIGERIPAGRWGKAADVGGLTVFLASRASDFIHGQTIAVDGGWLAR